MMGVVLQTTSQHEVVGTLALFMAIGFTVWFVYQMWKNPPLSMHEIEMENIRREAEKQALREEYGLDAGPRSSPSGAKSIKDIARPPEPPDEVETVSETDDSDDDIDMSALSDVLGDDGDLKSRVLDEPYDPDKPEFDISDDPAIRALDDVRVPEQEET